MKKIAEGRSYLRGRGAVLTALAASCVLGACATVPSAPSVLALPGSGKSVDAFRADDLQCQQDASAQVATGESSRALQRRYDAAYIQCMYAKGHKVPVPGDFTSAPPGSPPPPAR